MKRPSRPVPNRKHRRGLVFINYNKDDRDPITKLSLINTNSAIISHRQRRVALANIRASESRRIALAYPASELELRRPRPAPLLLTSDGYSEEHAPYHEERHMQPVEPVQHGKWGRRPMLYNVQYESPPSDAFGQLPIENKGYVQMAFEFYAHAYAAPLTSNRQSNTGNSESGFQTCVQVMMQDAMLFEQTMAYSLAMQSAVLNFEHRMTPAILRISTRSAARLRARLQAEMEGGGDGGNIIMTIVFLAATFMACGEFGAVGVHAKALRNVVSLLGGYRKLGWNGFLEMKARQIEGVWTEIQNKPKTVPAVLSYPKHPFEPALCESISRLPVGLRELALRQKLSIQFIHVLNESKEFLNRRQDGAVAATVSHCIDGVTRFPELTLMERLLAFALLGYCLHQTAALRLTMISLHANVRSLPPDRETYVFSEAEEDALDWAALMLCATTEKGSDAWKWAHRILKCTNSSRTIAMSDSRQKLLEEAFFKIPQSEDFNA